MSKPRSLGSNTPASEKEKRTFCPHCIEYLDGKPVKNLYDGRTERSPQPGWQRHRTSTGPLALRVGLIVPCTCAAGQAFQRGMFNPDSQTNNEPWFDTYTQTELKPYERPAFNPGPEPAPLKEFVPAGRVLQENFL